MMGMLPRAREMANGVGLTISFSTISNIYSINLVDPFGNQVYFPHHIVQKFSSILLHSIYQVAIQSAHSKSIHGNRSVYFSLLFSSADSPTTFRNVPKLKQSLMRLAPEKSITRRSTPHPQPPVGGRP